VRPVWDNDDADDGFHWSKIREIGVANQMNLDEAVQKFMKDVELYDDKLGYEAQLHNLKAGIQNEPTNQTSMLAIISYLILAYRRCLEDIQKISQFRPLWRAAKRDIISHIFV